MVRLQARLSAHVETLNTSHAIGRATTLVMAVACGVAAATMAVTLSINGQSLSSPGFGRRLAVRPRSCRWAAPRLRLARPVESCPPATAGSCRIPRSSGH
jgi:hypothetical protein